MDKYLQEIFIYGHLLEIKTGVTKAAFLCDKSSKETLRKLIFKEIDNTLDAIYAESPKLNDDQVKNLKDLWSKEHGEGK